MVLHRFVWIWKKYNTPRNKTKNNFQKVSKVICIIREKERGKKRTNYRSEFKVKLVLEVLKNEKSLSQIASLNNVLPRNLQKWSKGFFYNAELVLEPGKSVKEYKEKIKEFEKKVDKYAKTVEKLIVERDWALGKLKYFDI
jgi:putative transposase